MSIGNFFNYELKGIIMIRNNNLRLWISSFFIIIYSLFATIKPACSREVVKICAEYKNTGKKYKVAATMLYGSELNAHTNSYDYDTYSKYAVIFWGNKQTSIIKFDSSFCPGYTGCDGQDQRGYTWHIDTNSFTCF